MDKKADHPRIRGEHSICLKFCHLTMGSSPHTRGAPSRPGVWGGGLQDHPRIRGEHHYQFSFLRSGGGSSPHTRGARQTHGSSMRNARIIPAYAGSTTFADAEADLAADHPRIRGEHEMRRIVVGGSERIIPAYAGSTGCRRLRRGASKDHPRIRGEHASFQMALRAARGSSPHTRGARGAGPMVSARRGIIPAYAGSTAVASASGRAVWDHPRIRGEHRDYRLVCK